MDAPTPTSDERPPTVGIKEAVAALGLSESTILRRIKDKKLVAYRDPIPGGFQWRIVLPGAGDPPPVADEPPATIADEPPRTTDGPPPTSDDPLPTTEAAMRAVVVYMQPLVVQLERERERAERAERERDSLLLTVGLLLGQRQADDTPPPPPPLAVPVAAQPPPDPAIIAPQTAWERIKAFFGGGA